MFYSASFTTLLFCLENFFWMHRNFQYDFLNVLEFPIWYLLLYCSIPYWKSYWREWFVLEGTILGGIWIKNLVWGIPKVTYGKIITWRIVRPYWKNVIILATNMSIFRYQCIASTHPASLYPRTVTIVPPFPICTAWTFYTIIESYCFWFDWQWYFGNGRSITTPIDTQPRSFSIWNKTCKTSPPQQLFPSRLYHFLLLVLGYVTYLGLYLTVTAVHSLVRGDAHRQR